MRINNLAATLVVTLSCASCVQPSEAGTGDRMPALGTTGGDGFRADMWSNPADELGGLAPYDPADPAQPEGQFAYRVCGLVAGARPLGKEAFCRSQPAPDVRRRCFSHVNDSVVSWRNWCYDEFYE